MLRTLLALLLFVAATLPASARKVPAELLENALFLDLKGGRVVIKLHPELAPNHVARIKELTRAGFYDGLSFHRVIEDFMAQTGDPTGTGTGGSEKPDLKAEFTDTPFKRGSLGAARTFDPDTANSQFFICLGAAPWLNGQYTNFGEVVSGMKLVDQIKKGAPGSGAVKSPDVIVKLQVAADAKDQKAADVLQSTREAD